MTRLRLLMLYVFLTTISVAQTKIYLKGPKYVNEWETFHGDYQFVNILDTSYLTVGHQEDMGAQYGHYYEFKNNVPDSEYLIFVDDTLRTRAFMKNFNKDSTWTNYYGNGKPSNISQYKIGKLNGKKIYYYETGLIRLKEKYVNDILVGTTTTFYESGKIESKIYYNKYGKAYKIKRFDKTGKKQVTKTEKISKELKKELREKKHWL